MLTTIEDSNVLREKIRKDLALMDIDDLKHLYNTIARLAAQKATRFADLDWEEKKSPANILSKRLPMLEGRGAK